MTAIYHDYRISLDGEAAGGHANQTYPIVRIRVN